MKKESANNEIQLDDIFRFIKSHNLAVVSTVSQDSKPQAAVVEFGEMPDLTIIIDCLNKSRKYRNLKLNNDVAVVIGWDKDVTVQLEGKAMELASKELEEAQSLYFAKNPRARKWADKPDVVYFAIKPSWIRYSDVSKHPWQIEEFDLEGDT